MHAKQSLRQQLVYFGRHYTPTWRYLFNLRATLAYRRERTALKGEAARILHELNQHGIAITSANQLFGSSETPEFGCYSELADTVAQVQQTWPQQTAQVNHSSQPEDIGRKTFLRQYLGEVPALDPQSVYARFALQPLLLSIANAYFGMYTQLRYYNIWHSLTTSAPPRESQLWHYDREDHFILKIFVYLSDVDEGAGPFTYALGTHNKGTLKAQPDFIYEQAVPRSNDEQMAAVIPQEKWLTALGPKGTIVFADTHGYHKGGLARERDRLLYTCVYTSPTSQAQEQFIRPALLPQPHSPLEKAQALALATPAKGIFS